MSTQPRQTALITGASGGIGEAFARKMAASAYNVILVARSADKLHALEQELAAAYNITATGLPYDLTDAAAPQAIYDTLQAQALTVDLLINNAGYATYGKFHEAELQKELNMIQLNITTLVDLTHRFLPGMVARRHGRILNVASTAAFQAGPLMAVYYASKAFVLSFSEALANELEGTGVTVTALCPGPTASGFQARAAMEESKLVQSGLMTAEAVVERGYAGLLAGETVVIPGLYNQVGTLAARLLPRKLMTRTVRNMQERVGH